MAELADNGAIPPWEQHHRLSRALEWGDVPAPDMAHELGVSLNTVYNYAAGRTKPSRAVLRVWALRCGVPFEWLERGDDHDRPEPPPNTPATECYRGLPVVTRELVAAA